ncbi:MAG: succinate dehydrogenase, hydrophobic membrane anchor protein [Desulfobacterales bacterium]
MMEKVCSAYYDIENLILKSLKNLPLIGFYAKIRGWDYVLSWIHRITGVLLVFYLWFHVYTLTSLTTPELFTEKMMLFQGAVFVFLEWLLAIPVIFHALNGGRLILYETFYSQPDAAVIRGTLIFSLFYVALLGFMMLIGNQQVSPVLLWLCCLSVSIAVSYIVALKLRHSKNSLGWKIQRVTGSFLLLMIPAHLLFMHLQPDVGHEVGVIIPRMQHGFIKIVNLLLLLCSVYHGGYGLIEIIKDYSDKKLLHYLSTIVIIIVMAAFFAAGAHLTIFI